MAPRVSKEKTIAKASSPIARAPSIDVDEVGDEFHEVYNNLLVIKGDLLATTPGADRKRLVGELGNHLVCDGLLEVSFDATVLFSLGSNASCPHPNGEVRYSVDFAQFGTLVRLG